MGLHDGVVPRILTGASARAISHDRPPNVTHILGNTAFIWLFAGESDQHMCHVEVIGFFVVTALTSVTISTALTGNSTLGANGGALAFVGFNGTHLYLAHWDSTELEVMDHPWREPVKLRAYWRVAMLAFPLALIVYGFGQYAGLIPVGQLDVTGHLVGVVHTSATFFATL